MKGSEFVFDFFQLLYCKCHEINPNHGASYIDSPDQIKNRKATINPINKKGNKCLTVTLNHEEIKRNLERITNIKPLTNKYKWEGINFPSEKNDWKKFEENNVTIVM